MTIDKRLIKLVDVADRSRGLEALLKDPEVRSFFESYEHECMNMIADADADDDEARREAGLRLKAMRLMRRELESAVASGKRASEKIKELQKDGA